MPSDSTLTLLIPDLFGFQSTLSQLSQEELSQLPVTRFPVLEKWLSRGTQQISEPHSDILSSEFGLKLDDNKDKPYAVLSLIAENNNLNVIYSTKDLYKEKGNEEAILFQTFYEKKFLNEGINIKYIQFQIENKEIIEPENL